LERAVSNNLFVAYDLISPGQSYDRVIDRIKTLGLWHQFQQSLFYVSTSLSADEAHRQVRAVMDPNDKLLVIDANGGIVSPPEPGAVLAVNQVWFGR
jgi:hypothetical protein